MARPIIKGDRSGRYSSWFGEEDPKGDELICQNLFGRLEDAEVAFQQGLAANWDTLRITDVVRAERNVAVQQTAMEALDRIAEGARVLRVRQSERRRRLIPDPPADAVEIRSTARQRGADAVSKWVFTLRNDIVRGDTTGVPILAALLADPARELLTGLMRDSLVAFLSNVTDPNEVAALERLDWCLGSLEQAIQEDRAYFVASGNLSKSAYFAQAQDEAHRRATLAALR